MSKNILLYVKTLCKWGVDNLFWVRINTMADNNEKNVKIRFKFRSGEEFEAEGSPEFIESQRAQFLQLIGKEGRAATTPRSSATRPQTRPFSAQEARSTTPSAADFPPLESAATAAFPRMQPASAPFPAQTDTAAPSDPEQLLLQPAALRSKSHTAAQPSAEAQRLWEFIVKVDDGHVYLRRKSRLITPETAALLLLAAAKVLLQENSYSALALAKSLAKSGYGGGRLDRLLGPDLRQGTLRAEGSKRSRAYLLSDEGFARAYVLAGKLAEEWR